MNATVRRFGPIALIVLTAVFCFGRLVLHPNSVIVDGSEPSLDHAMAAVDRAVGNDLTRFFWPLHLRIWTAIHRDGRLPSWDESGFGGRPLVGNPQAGLWYPPVWVVWWTQSAPMLSWLTIGHLIWGAFGVLALGREIGVGRFARAVAASCWLAAPYILAQTLEGHMPHVWAASWYPWAFWAFRRWRANGFGLRGAPWLPLFVAASLLTGHPQEGYCLGVTLGIWFLHELIKKSRKNQVREILPPAIVAVSLLVLLLGLLSVELLPDLSAGAWGLRSGALKLREASRYHVGALNLLQLLSPRALGGPADFLGYDNYWESLLGFGFVPLVLIAVAVTDSPLREETKGWGLLLAWAVLFAAGRQLGLFAALYYVLPGLDRFRVPSRALFLANLGAVMLIGLGIDALRGVEIAKTARRYGIFIVVMAVLVGIGAPFALREDSGRIPAACSLLVREPRFLTVAVAVGMLLGLASVSKPARRRLPIMVGLLAVGELAAYGHQLIQVAPVSRFVGSDPIADAIDRHRPVGPFRIRVRDTFYPDLPAFARGFEKVNMNDSFQIQHAARLYQKLYPIAEPLPPVEAGDPALAAKNRAVRRAILNLLNVAFVVADRSVEALGWPVVERGTREGKPFVVQENPDRLPRAYVVPRAVVVPEDPNIYGEFLRVSPREAVLMAVDPLANEGKHRQEFTAAVYHAETSGRVDVAFTTSAPGLLVVADTWMPGWSGTLDGTPVEVLRGNLAQRVVPIRRAGPHRVVMTYTPPGLAAGAAVSVFSLVIVTGLLMFGRLMRVSGRQTHP